MTHKTPPYLFHDDFIERRMRLDAQTPATKNLAWIVEPGVPDSANPLLSPAYPWDSASPFNSGTVLKDPIDGLWKCWGLAWPHTETGRFEHQLTYATSEDGVHWTRPMLDGFPCMGRAKSNVLLTYADLGMVGASSVIVHPHTKPSRRYELFVHAYPPFKNPTKHAKGFPIRPEHKEEHPGGVWRYFSADGIHWKPAEGPLDLDTADSIFIHKEAGGPYVAYHKIGRTAAPGAFVHLDCAAGEQRVLVRRESRDGSKWSLYETIMQPDWRDAHDTQFMDLSPLRQGSGYVAIVAVYHALNQTMDLQFAGSPDGRQWFRPIPRMPCLFNQTGAALYYNSHEMIEDGDHLYFYYAAMEGLHSAIYGKTCTEYLQYGTLCRARWEKGRLWAAVPAAGGPTEAEFTTMPLDNVVGKQLVINAVTHGDGAVTAELCLPIPSGHPKSWDGEPGKGPAGFSFTDARAFRGDEKLHVFSWKGGSRAPRDGVMLRFRIKRAKLYGFEWR